LTYNLLGVEHIILRNNYDQMPHINRLGAKRMRGFRPTTLVSSKYRALNTMVADPDKNSLRKTDNVRINVTVMRVRAAPVAVEKK
jgi:hypothetical protein